MPPSIIRRAAAVALLVGLGALTSACDRTPEGAIKVAVIGDPPTFADPATAPLSPGQSVLLASVAQGLVRFDARGQIEPGLAERWNVSDDGLSYVFRLASREWPNGGRVTAEQVARLLRRTIGQRSKNPLKDTLGGVDEIVAMTDRVIEIRLKAPRPNLLQLLAQPEFAIVRNGQGSGPFSLADDDGDHGTLRLSHRVGDPDEGTERKERVDLQALSAPDAIRAFGAGSVDLVLGGSFADLPYARRAKLPRGALQFDPASGLFGLVPARADGPLANPEVRRLLAQAIDRDALMASLNVPGLSGRATILQTGLDDVPQPVTPVWLATPLGERRPELIERADRLFADAERRTLRIALPEGPGAALLLRRLANDWGLLGIQVERARNKASADLILVDEVAPSTSPAWFARRFRCGQVPICDPESTELLDAARLAPVAAQRAAFFAEATRRMDELQLFIPLAAPIRWSLLSGRVQGFAGNRFARHTLIGLDQQLEREGGR